VTGKSYTGSAYAKGANATGTSRVALSWYDNNFNYLGSNYSSNLPIGTTSWQLLSDTATAPANAAYVELHLQSENDTGSVWFDDAAFVAN
jgi:hypothetical protein